EKKNDIKDLEKTLKETKNNINEFKQTATKENVRTSHEKMNDVDKAYQKDNEKAEEKTTEEMFNVENEIVTDGHELDV
ncbi:hypothetical protein C9J21_22540, partial [Photobacterium phosphoreum]|uniref:hypothetical protein n=1 Tax=Photobacterium phosphoreum TaxID=659 RepID=UPI000D47752A